MSAEARQETARDRIVLHELALEIKLLISKVPARDHVLTPGAKELVKDLDAALRIAVDELEGF